MGKGRERQIILKTDQRTVLLEMGLGGNSNRNQAHGTRTEPVLEGDVLEVEYAMAARVLTHVPAGPRPAPPPAQHYFPTEE
jgi:hypothetical protein